MDIFERILNDIEKERGNESDYSTVEDKNLVRHWNNCIDVVKEIITSYINDGWVGYYCKIRDCSTCKNNVEFPPPHTCDICTSLDQEDYCMWEPKE